MEEGPLGPFLCPVAGPTTSPAMANEVYWETLPMYYRLVDKFVAWREWIDKARPLPKKQEQEDAADDLDDLFDPDAGQKRPRTDQ